MNTANTEWRWIKRFAEQFQLNGMKPGDEVVILSESASRPELVATSILAAEYLGARPFEVVMRTPANGGPVALRSTGTSLALKGHSGAVSAVSSVPLVIDVTVEGLLHSRELREILGAGTSVFMISNEHPEIFERLPHDEVMADRVAKSHDFMRTAKTMRATSDMGTHIEVELADAFTAGSTGVIGGPGEIAHWPGGLVLAFPARHRVNGQIVLAPGDINITFKHYVQDPITLMIEDDYVVAIEGKGYQADMLKSYMSAFDKDAYATSHIGWGMNPAARWDYLELYDRSQFNGTEARAFEGNFMYSTGANENAERFSVCHFDIPMRNCSVYLDDHQVVDAGRLTGVAAGEEM
jgi:2,5-dihydroxypyridine 5,6-dioxygenase